MKEIMLLNSAISQHLCGFYGVCWGENEYPGIVLEYVANGSLELLLHGKNSRVDNTSWTDPYAKVSPATSSLPHHDTSLTRAGRTRTLSWRATFAAA